MVMSGKARARSSKISRQKAMEANTLALSTLVTWPRRPSALRWRASLQREVADTGRAGAGDLHGVEHGVGLDDAAATGVEQAFGALAHQHQVDLGRTRMGQWCRQAGPGADRSHARIEIQREAQVQLRNDLGAVGATHMRQAHGAEQDGIGRAAGGQRGLGQGHATVQVVLRAGGVGHGAEIAADAPGHRLQHGQGTGRDFAADAIARQDGNRVAGLQAHHALTSARRGNARTAPPVRFGHVRGGPGSRAWRLRHRRR
jgi:hypothetical protein